ncbi:MAG TPA: preprotein translocase subunit YajC [bacterium]|nr:preprotein translocase subunit YajC [bacterium]
MIFGQVQPAQGGAAAIGALLPLILIFFVFYFLLILPQQKKQKVHKKMLDEIKEGDKIITVGGILGTVGKIKDNVVTVELKDGVKVDFVRNAISQVVKGESEQK